MKFKILKNSPLFKELKDIEAKCREVNRAAGKLAKKHGAKEWLSNRHYLAGGIAGFQLDKKPENWKQIYKDHFENCYFPKSCKANKELLEEISKLPKVEIDTLNKALGFKFQFVGSKVYYSPGVRWNKNYILVEIGENAKYKPKKGMIEITYSEYEKLKK